MIKSYAAAAVLAQFAAQEAENETGTVEGVLLSRAASSIPGNKGGVDV